MKQWNPNPRKKKKKGISYALTGQVFILDKWAILKSYIYLKSVLYTSKTAFENYFLDIELNILSQSRWSYQQQKNYPEQFLISWNLVAAN